MLHKLAATMNVTRSSGQVGPPGSLRDRATVRCNELIEQRVTRVNR
jgi:hypothetical protein